MCRGVCGAWMSSCTFQVAAFAICMKSRTAIAKEVASPSPCSKDNEKFGQRQKSLYAGHDADRYLSSPPRVTESTTPCMGPSELCQEEEGFKGPLHSLAPTLCPAGE